jgi:hypothetical protein
MKTLEQLFEPLVFADDIVLDSLGEDIQFVSKNDAMNAARKFASAQTSTLKAENDKLRELVGVMKNDIEVYAKLVTRLLDCAKDVIVFTATSGLKGNQTAFSDNEKELVEATDKIINLREDITELEQELGLNKE